jgi:hypothetical protein
MYWLTSMRSRITRWTAVVVVERRAGLLLPPSPCPVTRHSCPLGIAASLCSPSDLVGGKGELIAQACDLRCQRFDFLITALKSSPEDLLRRFSGISLPLYGLQRLMRQSILSSRFRSYPWPFSLANLRRIISATMGPTSRSRLRRPSLSCSCTAARS